MTTDRPQDVERLIDEFMMDHPSPEPDDWRRLIDAYPEYAAVIADAAIFRWGARDREKAKDELSSTGERVFADTISQVLNTLHQTPGSALSAPTKRVASLLGPSAKTLAIEIGIGPYGSLINGILVGRTHAPKRVLEAIANKLEVSSVVLSEVFRRSFEESTVPAFKANAGKPTVPVYPASWEEAVHAMDVGPDETARLLGYADES